IASDSMSLALHGEFRFDGYDPKDSLALQGMKERKQSFDAGISFNYSAIWGQTEIIYIADATDTHDGDELRLTYQYPYTSGKWLVVPSIGINWQDESLVDYYYGVTATEASAERPEYNGFKASNVFAQLSMGYQIDDDLKLLAGVKYSKFDDDILASPIISRSTQADVFAAVVYIF
ncbi:MAG: MipA/OmpV family protein, partial [Enterobacterales bacterium]|nr:MipA/OmpV family protein [Enterobacterales bacterium]